MPRISIAIPTIASYHIMMKNRYFCLVIFALLSSNSALNATEVKAPVLADLPMRKSENVPGPVLDQAIALAKFTNSEAKIQSQILGTIEVTLPQMLRSDAQFSALEKAYPGLIAVIVESLKPKMLAAYAQKTPLLWERLGSLYANNLTSAELNQMMAFYKSPTGQKVLTGFSQTGNNANILKQTRETGGADMDKLGAAAQRDLAATARKVSASFTDTERVAIFKFENSPLGVKLAKLVPQVQRTVIEWDVYFTPEQMNDFASTRAAAVTAFIAEADAKKSPTANDAPATSVEDRT
jgi:hypothetical protein